MSEPASSSAGLAQVVRPDLGVVHRIHLVGVGGSGMSAIATVLAAMGHQVSGSDAQPSAVVEQLRSEGVPVDIGHHADHVTGVDLVAASTAVPDTNPEIQAAVAAGVPVLTRADILAAIAAKRRTIAVSGTHGKTTTSSMLARVLVEAGLRPSYIVGGQSLDAEGFAAAWDTGEWFVVEADESDGTFVELGAEIAVVTSVEADHLDYYGSMDGIEAAFDRFVAEASGPNVVCVDDANAARLAAVHGAVTYGTDAIADYRIEDPRLERTGVQFTLSGPSIAPVRVDLPAPGLYNARNAGAAIVTATLLGVPPDVAATALASYAGVARRFQVRGVAFGATVVDDYAHNPGKVDAVLAASRAAGWDRIVVVFQPHRYSRTEALAAAFADSFVDADVVVVTDVYGAGEAPRAGVTGKLIVDAALDAHPRQRLVWLPERRDLVPFLAAELRPGDLCLTLGAGDITSLATELMLADPSGGLDGRD